MQERQISGRQMSEPLQNVNVYTMIADVASQWFSVLTFTAAAVMLAYVIMRYLRPQQEYATTATLVILNAYEGMEDVIYYTDEYAQQNLNSSDTASKLGSIMNSAELKGLVAKELRLGSFQGTVTSSLLGQSNIIKVTVRAKTPYISYMECASIIKNYSKYSSELLGGIELSVLENPTVPERVERPFKILFNSMLAGVGVFPPSLHYWLSCPIYVTQCAAERKRNRRLTLRSWKRFLLRRNTGNSVSGSGSDVGTGMRTAS